jgi:hypothetical protein
LASRLPPLCRAAALLASAPALAPLVIALHSRAPRPRFQQARPPGLFFVANRFAPRYNMSGCRTPQQMRARARRVAMNRSIGVALVLAALVTGGSLGIGASAHAASVTAARTNDSVSSTDLSARRRGPRATHHVRRQHRLARPYYYGRPRYYRPSPAISPFFPFGLGYGLPAS